MPANSKASSARKIRSRCDEMVVCGMGNIGPWVFEEILRGVIQNELNLIIITGYVLGGLIGVCTFGLQKLLGL